MKGVTLALALALAVLTWTQFSLSQRDHQASKSHATDSTDRQRSPEKQVWCTVLKSALSGAAGQEPRMRSYLLDAVAGGLSQCAPEKVHNALVDSFTATLALPETWEEFDQRQRGFYHNGQQPDEATEEFRFNLQMKETLQRCVLGHLLTIDEATVDSLLPQAEPNVRAGLMRQMISQATSAKKFDRAIELLSRRPSKEWFPRMFPFREATQLMLELPPNREEDKQQIFRVVMAADRERRSFTTSGDDLAGMIVRFWRQIPPAMVLEAIHQVLDKPNLIEDGLTLNSSSVKLAFSNEHDYHVFELLPIVRELDADAAEKLLQSSQQAQLHLKQFPNGIQSVDPSLGDTAPKQDEAAHRVWLSTAELDRGANHADPVNPASARVREIVRTAPDNPAQATAAASTLPEAVGFSDVPVLFPRAEAYLGIARTLMKSDPSVARDALEQMTVSLDHMANPHLPIRQWTDGMMVAKEMGDVELAVGLFRSGMEVAERLRSEDSDPADPNMAIKAFWPSVCAYSGLALAASQISPQTALDGIRDIKDPEILLLLEIKLANKILGAREVPSSTIVQKKLSHSGFYGGCAN